MKWKKDKSFVDFISAAFLWLLVCSGIFLYPAEAGEKKVARKYNEYKIKALFIIRFAEFTLWPPHSNVENPHMPFTIGAAGDMNIIPFLTQIIQKKKITIHGKEIKIIGLSDDSDKDIKKCNIVLFFSTPDEIFKRMIKEIDNLPVLTIGNGEEYEKENVMINLFIKAGKKVRFKVKRRTADKSGICLTSKILRHAEEILE